MFQQGMVCVNRLLDAVALCWVAMWFGLRARKPFSFVAWTVGLVIVLPWVLSYLLIILLSVAGGLGLGTWPSGTVHLWSVGWPLLNVAKNIILIRWAASRLQAELRATAPLAIGDWLREDGRAIVDG